MHGEVRCACRKNRGEEERAREREKRIRERGRGSRASSRWPPRPTTASRRWQGGRPGGLHAPASGRRLGPFTDTPLNFWGFSVNFKDSTSFVRINALNLFENF
jgi:hypothetical protein